MDEKNLNIPEGDTYNIYIELDCILDTRLPLLDTLCESTAIEMVSSGAYHNRYMDEFGNIPITLFKELYKQRNKGILKLALPTPIFEVVNMIAVRYITDKGNQQVPILYINTFPYSLNKEEQKNILEYLSPMFQSYIVELVYMNPETEVVPKWVDKNVDSLIMYNGGEWIEYHNAVGNLSNCPLVLKTLVTPALVVEKPKELKINHLLFRSVQEGVKPNINLEYIDSKYFSGIIKK